MLRTKRCTECRPRFALWQFWNQRGAAIGELTLSGSANANHERKLEIIREALDCSQFCRRALGHHLHHK